MASASSSTVSVQKSSSGLSTSNRRKSCETVCSSNSSCFLQKKKPTNPLAMSVRSLQRSGGERNSVVRQRVLSAKLIKVRSLQSQLNDANYHLMELAKENRALKTLQRRQDRALNNYEGVNADLPRLIKSHEEENRTLTERNRVLKKQVKELTDQIKMKDDELFTLREQLKRLLALSKDRHLGEREKLKEMLDESKLQIAKYETEIGLLNRRLMLETKNAKQKLNAESTKLRKCQRELAEALQQIDVVNEGKVKMAPKRRFGVSPRPKQSVSMVCLNSNESLDISDIRDHSSDSSSDIKLEPINKRSEGSDSARSRDPSMQSPADKIKARLSASVDKRSSVNQITDLLDKLTVEEESLKKLLRNGRTHRPTSKLKTLPPAKVDTNDYLDECHRKVAENVANANALVEQHNDELVAMHDIDDKILEEIAVADEIAAKIKGGSIDGLLLEDGDLELVNEIWNEEFDFQRSRKDSNGNVTGKEPAVAVEDKKRLLAKLRDIDNGKSVDEVDGIDKKSRLIKELFG